MAEQKYSILTVDDSLTVHTIAEKIFENTEFNIIDKAHDGDQALEMYKKNSPDFVLLDIVMSNSCGMTALKNIMNYDVNASIVMATSIESYVEEALKIGAKGYLVKPFDQEQVLIVLRTLIKQDIANRP